MRVEGTLGSFPFLLCHGSSDPSAMGQATPMARVKRPLIQVSGDPWRILRETIVRHPLNHLRCRAWSAA